MVKQLFNLLLLAGVILTTSCTKKEKRPNVLLIMADDISRTSMGIYGCDYIQTPNLDKIGREGIKFENAFTCNPKCAPSRASILSGRYSWQLEEACNHNGVMPEKWKFYPELLEEAGYFMGFTGKGWGPGHFSKKHNPAGWEYNDIKCKPPYKSISTKDYVANFKAFLDKKDDDKPFCFWFGTHEAHRAFEKNVHRKKNKQLSKVKVQKCFPDNEIIRGDLADYGVEVEYHDEQVGKALKVLEERGLLENTLIIVTSDHGMAFPHIKGQIYDESFHIPFLVRWGNKIKSGRTVTDFINFPDVAPTIMEAVGLKPHEQMTGKSFLDILLSDKNGQIDKSRKFAIIGKERHDVGRTDGELHTVGYPIRSIRTKKYLYVKNYIPTRWPVGNPEYGYLNCDASPTKSYLLSLEQDRADYKYYTKAFDKRSAEELYDVVNDPDCCDNLAEKTEYQTVKLKLKATMIETLKEQNDPRVLGNGEIFDYYPHGRPDKLISIYGEEYYDMYEKFNTKYGIYTPPIPADSTKINKKIIQNYYRANND